MDKLNKKDQDNYVCPVCNKKSEIQGISGLVLGSGGGDFLVDENPFALLPLARQGGHVEGLRPAKGGPTVAIAALVVVREVVGVGGLVVVGGGGRGEGGVVGDVLQQLHVDAQLLRKLRHQP